MGVKGLIDKSLGSIAARKLMYANKMGEGRSLRERQLIADDGDGSRERPRRRRWPFSAPLYALKSPQFHSTGCHFHSTGYHFHSTGAGDQEEISQSWVFPCYPRRSSVPGRGLQGPALTRAN